MHQDEDKKRKEEADLHNEADALAFRAGKAISEYKDKLPKEIVDDVQTKIDAVKKALESKDNDKIRTAKQELETHMQQIGEAMSKAAGAAQGQQGPTAEQPHAQTHEQPHSQGQSQGNGDNIEEAEVEIIDDNEKK